MPPSNTPSRLAFPTLGHPKKNLRPHRKMEVLPLKPSMANGLLQPYRSFRTRRRNRPRNVQPGGMAFYRTFAPLSLFAFALLTLGCGGSPDLTLPDLGEQTPPPPVDSRPLLLEAPRVFQAGSSPFLMACGDIDGDGLVDLAVSERFGRTVSVLKAHRGDHEREGEPAYEPPIAVEMGPSPAGVALADLDGDGHLDLVVSNRTETSLSWRKGDGDGGFGALQSLEVGASPQGLLAVDLDGDGYLDLATANVADGTVSVLFGSGSGVFEAPLTMAVGQEPVDLVAGDLDGDGRLDLVVSNFTSNDISVLRQSSDRSFEDESRLAAGRNPFGLALGDLDGDGRLDLVVCHELDGELGLFRGLGDGTFERYDTLVTSGEPNQVVLAELDGRPGLDIAVSVEKANSVELFTGRGDGTFGGPTTFGAGYGPVGLLALPAVEEGRRHLVCTNFFGSGVTVFVALGEGVYRSAPRTPLDAPPLDLTFLGTASRELLAVTQQGRSDVSLRVLTEANELPPWAAWTLPSPAERLGALPLGQLFAGLEDGVALGEGTDTLATLPLPDSGGPLALDSKGEHAAVLSADGRRLDLLKIDRGSVNLLGTAALPVPARDVALFDLDGDGRIEALLLSSDGASIDSYLLGLDGSLALTRSLEVEGGITFVPSEDRLLLLSTDAVWQVRETAIEQKRDLPPGSLRGLARDIDGDGWVDLLVVNSDRRLLAAFAGRADGGFSAPREYAVGGEPVGVAAGRGPGGAFRVVVADSSGPALSTLEVR